MKLNTFEIIKENRKYSVIIIIAFILEIIGALWIKSVDGDIYTIIFIGFVITLIYFIISILILFYNNKFIKVLALSNLFSTAIYSSIIVYSNLAFMRGWIISEFSLFLIATIIYIAILKENNSKLAIVIVSLIYFALKFLIPLITFIANGLGRL